MRALTEPLPSNAKLEITACEFCVCCGAEPNLIRRFFVGPLTVTLRLLTHLCRESLLLEQNTFDEVNRATSIHV
jgi:hypothetical protein